MLARVLKMVGGLSPQVTIMAGLAAFLVGGVLGAAGAAKLTYGVAHQAGLTAGKEVGRLDCEAAHLETQTRAQDAAMTAAVQSINDAAGQLASQQRDYVRQVETIKGALDAIPDNLADCLPGDAARRMQQRIKGFRQRGRGGN
jgi:hypothetical protein